MSCSSCSSCGSNYLYLNNDHILTLSDVTGTDIEGNTETITDALVTYQIYDTDGDEVEGASGTLEALGTSGDYSVDIDKDIINLCTLGEEYEIRVTGYTSGTSEDSSDFEFSLTFICKRRGSS